MDVEIVKVPVTDNGSLHGDQMRSALKDEFDFWLHIDGAFGLAAALTETARLAHTQHAEYLDTLTESSDFNPSDYSVQLTRRARGLPLWFSLATYGADAYRRAITASIDLAHEAATEIAARDYLQLVREPQLSVVVFERIGWDAADYATWSKQLLDEQHSFVVPSSHSGRVNTRFAIVNPRTTMDDLRWVLDSMA